MHDCSKSGGRVDRMKDLRTSLSGKIGENKKEKRIVEI